jgi:hypothetical protein
VPQRDVDKNQRLAVPTPAAQLPLSHHLITTHICGLYGPSPAPWLERNQYFDHPPSATLHVNIVVPSLPLFSTLLRVHLLALVLVPCSHGTGYYFIPFKSLPGSPLSAS